MSEPSIRALVLAGGRGTRLKPFTYVLPKPLVPVGDRPILLLLIERLKACGITDLTLCVNHMADLLMTYFGDGEKFGVRIAYAMESEPLGTVAPLRRIAGLPDDFLVLNGDLLTDLDFSDLFRHHRQSGKLLTVGVTRREVRIDFGVLEMANGELTSFSEKPVHEFWVSTGVYAFSRSVLGHIPEQGPFGFDQLMGRLLERRVPVGLYPFHGYWLDIGRPEDFERANEDVMKLETCPNPRLPFPDLSPRVGTGSDRPGGKE